MVSRPPTDRTLHLRSKTPSGANTGSVIAEPKASQQHSVARREHVEPRVTGTRTSTRRENSASQQAAAAGVPPVDPILLSINAATKVGGFSRSELYRQITAGRIRAVKMGSRTLITVESLREFIANLPAADIRSSP